MKPDVQWDAFRDALVPAPVSPAAIWREGRRRKRWDQARRVGLPAAAAMVAWLAAVLFRPHSPAPAAIANEVAPAAPAALLVQVTTPDRPDSASLLVRTGDVDTRLEYIPADGVLQSLKEYSVAWAGHAGQSPRLYIQPPGSTEFVPVN